MTFELINEERGGTNFLVESMFHSGPGGSLWRVLRNWKGYSPEEIEALQATRNPRLLQQFLNDEADVLVHSYHAYEPEHITFVADLAPPNRYLRQRRSGSWYLTDRDWWITPRLEFLVF
jgi:hypothetical protein